MGITAELKQPAQQETGKCYNRSGYARKSEQQESAGDHTDIQKANGAPIQYFNDGNILRQI